MRIQHGAKIVLHYSLVVEGEKIDSSDESEPLAYIHGEGQMIPGFEKNLEGMRAGEEKQFQVDPDLGYGQRDEEMIRQVPKEEFEDETLLKEGEVLSGSVGQQPFQALILEVGEDEVVLDFNHPLAGRTLDFDVKVISVESAETST